ncbi:MAG: hypothetical protein M3Q99_15185 [Acidobacteriota bacterium]|nr:hypothetical protein [Acidobacteriota bacterium]
MANFKLDDEEKDKNDEPSYSQTFSTKNADIEITYSTGNCSDDSDDSDELDKWNVSKGKVTFIEISLNKPFKFKELKLDISSFRKEQEYANVEDSYVYHNKDLGVAFVVNKGEIETIHLFPTNSYYSSLCENEEAEELKEFYSKESYFRNSELEERVYSDGHAPANVTNLILSASEIIIGCDEATKTKNCSDGNTEISVTTEASDPENDVLTFNYTVSGGKIVGQGAKVVWDLWGVKPGIYTITAGVDDGCGVCGATVTKTITVKEFYNSSVK